MVVLKDGRIQSATILEVVVAMVVIMLIFGISMMVYMNVLRSSSAYQLVYHHLLLRELSEETIVSKSYFDERIERQGVVVRKTVRKYGNSDKLIYLHLEIESAGKKVVRDELIKTSWEDEED